MVLSADKRALGGYKRQRAQGSFTGIMLACQGV